MGWNTGATAMWTKEVQNKSLLFKQVNDSALILRVSAHLQASVWMKVQCDKVFTPSTQQV